MSVEVKPAPRARGIFHRLHWPAFFGLILALGVLASRGRADAPVGRYVFPGGDTVLDTRTGLTWQRVTPADGYSWADAGEVCRSLNLDGTGWRLPSMKELQTLVDVSRQAPAIDVTAFPVTMSGLYWTSSALVGTSSDAWTVDFNTGASGAINRDGSMWVRCVR